MKKSLSILMATFALSGCAGKSVFIKSEPSVVFFELNGNDEPIFCTVNSKDGICFSAEILDKKLRKIGKQMPSVGAMPRE